MVLPRHALHREAQALRYEFHSLIRTTLARYRHKTLLNQPRADAPCAEALGEKNFLQLHMCFCHACIVARSFRLPDYAHKCGHAIVLTHANTSANPI